MHSRKRVWSEDDSELLQQKFGFKESAAFNIVVRIYVYSFYGFNFQSNNEFKKNMNSIKSYLCIRKRRTSQQFVIKSNFS